MWLPQIVAGDLKLKKQKWWRFTFESDLLTQLVAKLGQGGIRHLAESYGHVGRLIVVKQGQTWATQHCSADSEWREDLGRPPPKQEVTDYVAEQHSMGTQYLLGVSGLDLALLPEPDLVCKTPTSLMGLEDTEASSPESSSVCKALTFLGDTEDLMLTPIRV